MFLRPTWWLPSLTLLVVVASGGHAPAADFPYTAFVAADDVYVRSGPGMNYYPTSKLGRGAKVQVFRHDPGGWYAIRPPAGSYSWISGEYLNTVRDNIAVAAGDRVIARVGSSFSDIRDVIQVRLERGETVEVLEAKRFGSGPGAQTWYKVAPPAGEFRWISGQFVARNVPEQPDRPPGYRRNLLIPTDGEPAAPEAAGGAVYEQTVSHEEVASSPSGLSSGLSHEDTPEPESTSAPPRIRLAAGVRDPYDHIFESGPSARAPRVARRTAPPAVEQADRVQEPPAAVGSRGEVVDEDTLRSRLEEIELDLSVMVAEETSVWSFHELRGRAERVLDNAATAVVRGRARLLLSRMRRFEEIRHNYDMVAEVETETGRRDKLLASIRSGRDAATGRPREFDRFDGMGTLTPVVSQRTGGPRYALLDSRGGVACYVTASPGVNLSQFVGRDVGINGTMGYLSDLKARHVTAKRIKVVDGRSIR